MVDGSPRAKLILNHVGSLSKEKKKIMLAIWYAIRLKCKSCNVVINVYGAGQCHP